MFGPDSQTLASAADKIELWEVASGVRKLEFGDHTKLVVATAFHPTEALLVSSSYDGSVRVWDTTDGTRVAQLHESAAVHDVAFDPSGRWLAAACNDKRVAVWDFEELRQSGFGPSEEHVPSTVLDGHGSPVLSVDFRADGGLLAASTEDGKIVLWEPGSWGRYEILNVDGRILRCVVFSPDGTLSRPRDSRTGRSSGASNVSRKRSREWDWAIDGWPASVFRAGT